jgi:hypothetical protein
MLFEIYHADEMATYTDAKEKAAAFPQGYSKVAVVEARDLCDTYRITNHIDAAWYDNPEVVELLNDQARSTSVGDVVVDEAGRAHLCACFGWEELEGTVT